MAIFYVSKNKTFLTFSKKNKKKRLKRTNKKYIFLKKNQNFTILWNRKSKTQRWSRIKKFDFSCRTLWNFLFKKLDENWKTLKRTSKKGFNERSQKKNFEENNVLFKVFFFVNVHWTLFLYFFIIFLKNHKTISVNYWRFIISFQVE